MRWYWRVLKSYAQFNGRARRSEFWWFNLIHIAVSVLLWALMVIPMFIADALGDGDPEPGCIARVLGLTFLAYTLGTFVPSLAVQARRLHDIGRSGWWMLISLIPLGVFVVLAFNFMNSQPGTNEYGANPKGE